MQALSAGAGATSLVERYEAVRQRSIDLCAPLELEDFGAQPIIDASPPKWHLAHSTWFFETFVLKPRARQHTAFHPLYEFLFNSYYNAVCEPFPRANRGHLSRPTVAEILRYRAHVDDAMRTLLSQTNTTDVQEATLLGLHHEQQHQELLLTDIKCILGLNPLQPRYRAPDKSRRDATETQEGYSFHDLSGGIVEIGHPVGAGFAFDNEQPRHEVLLRPFQLGARLVTNGEYLEFIIDGGYQRPEFWLSDGWILNKGGTFGTAPLYWCQREGRWFEYRLDGSQPLRMNTPVVHVSYFEADAFARWRGARLPTEAEWESAAAAQSSRISYGNFAESGVLHPLPASAPGLTQLFGDVWEWTSSAYAPYPGFRPRSGPFSEYNGKFMANQMVLRGGSCATPRSHVRTSYRNFFYPSNRWQYSGIRLAKDN